MSTLRLLFMFDINDLKEGGRKPSYSSLFHFDRPVERIFHVAVLDACDRVVDLLG